MARFGNISSGFFLTFLRFFAIIIIIVSESLLYPNSKELGVLFFKN